MEEFNPNMEGRGDTSSSFDGLWAPSARPDVTPSGEFAKGLMAELQSGTKIVSFDVFDTLISRNLGHHEGVFYQMGRVLKERGLIDTSAEVFAKYRKECEARARRNGATQEVSLDDIYEEMALATGLGGHVADFVALEMSLERQALRPIPMMREVVRAVRKSLGRVAFVSDMYLPHDFLAELLKEFEILEEGDRLYVSSTYGLQKYRTGDLFSKVLECECVRPNEMLHCGNSQVNDIDPAEKLGIPTYHFNEGNCNVSEDLLNRPYESEGEVVEISGASRLVRLAGLELDDDLRAIWNTGASVTGPIAYLYARWLIERARSLGLDTLLFLARDAYFPYLAVNKLLAAEPESGIKAHYVYGSRPTYYALGMSRLAEDEWEILTQFGGERYSSISDLVKGLMIGEEVMKGLLPAFGLSENDWIRPLNEEEVTRIREVVINDARVNALILDEIRRYQDVVKRYFEGLGVNAGSRVGLVDSGWTTRSHKPLFSFVTELGCEVVKMFYVGLTGGRCHLPPEALETFLFNQATRRGAHAAGFNYARPLESLFIAPHGRTAGFEDEGGVVQPVLEPVENRDFIDRYFGCYEDAIERFFEEVGDVAGANCGLSNLGGFTDDLIRRFWESPDSDEARVWSQLSWEWDPLGKNVFFLGQAYSPKDVWLATASGRWPEPYAQFWVGAAKQLSSPILLSGIKVGIWANRKLRGVFQLLPVGIQSALRSARKK